MIVVLPTIFVVTVRFVPEETGDLDALLAMLPVSFLDGGIEQALIQIILNNILPVFFLIIPIMTSSVMAAGFIRWGKKKNIHWKHCSTAPCLLAGFFTPRSWHLFS